MYDFVIKFHILVSSLFLVVASIVVTWSVRGWLKGWHLNRRFRRLSAWFLRLLYVELITGVALYFFLHPEQGNGKISLAEAMEQNELRFWAIEHVSMMLFALILSQIGSLLIKQLASDRKKLRAASLYYGVSLIVVLISAAVAIF